MSGVGDGVTIPRIGGTGGCLRAWQTCRTTHATQGEQWRCRSRSRCGGQQTREQTRGSSGRVNVPRRCRRRRCQGWPPSARVLATASCASITRHRHHRHGRFHESVFIIIARRGWPVLTACSGFGGIGALAAQRGGAAHQQTVAVNGEDKRRHCRVEQWVGSRVVAATACAIPDSCSAVNSIGEFAQRRHEFRPGPSKAEAIEIEHIGRQLLN